MSFATPLPWWGLALLIAVAAAVAYRGYHRAAVPLTGGQRAALSGVRLGAFLVLIGLLLRPVAIEPVAARDAVIPVLIDRSRSMSLVDDGDRPRLDRAVTLVRDVITPALGGEFQIVPLEFGEQVTEATLDQLTPDASQSDIAAALQTVAERFEGRSVAGVVLISDGGDTSGRDLIDMARQLEIPVFAVGVGSTPLTGDREVLSVIAGQPALQDSVVELAASIVSHGGDEGPIEVRLLEDGQPIQVRRVIPPADGSPTREVFRVAPKAAASTLYAVEIPAGGAEPALENNTRSVLVRPPGRPRRILILEGAPGFEHSFLKRVWQDDPGLEVDAVVRKGQNDRGEQTFYVQGSASRTGALSQGYPVTREALFVYDGVVLANVDGAFLRPDQLQMTADFVAQRGGGVLVMGALTFGNRLVAESPVADVLPLDWTDRGGPRPAAYSMAINDPDTVVLTTDGEAHPMMQLGSTPAETQERWEEMPALTASVQLGAPRPGASLLAVTEAPGGDVRPLVAIQRYRSGRAMVFTGEGSWRWRMRVPVENRAYEIFWRQVARWLTADAGDPVRMTTTGGQAPGGVVRADVHARASDYSPVVDATVAVRVTTPGGETRDLTATLADAASGRYAAEFQAGESGVYRIEATARAGDAELGAAQEAVLVGGADLEMTDPRLHEPLLRRVADASGGAYLTSSEVAELPSLLRAQASEAAPPIVRDLWNTAWVFLLVVTLLTVEWTLRRQWGLR